MGDDSRNRVPLTCGACGEEFSYAIPKGSPVPVPCPNCGSGVRTNTGDGESSDPTAAERPEGNGSAAGATLQGVGALDRLTPGPPGPYSAEGPDSEDPDDSDSDDDATHRIHRPPVGEVDDRDRTAADGDQPSPGEASSETDGVEERSDTDSRSPSTTPTGLPSAGGETATLGDSDSAVDKLRKERAEHDSRSTNPDTDGSEIEEEGEPDEPRAKSESDAEDPSDPDRSSTEESEAEEIQTDGAAADDSENDDTETDVEKSQEARDPSTESPSEPFDAPETDSLDEGGSAPKTSDDNESTDESTASEAPADRSDLEERIGYRQPDDQGERSDIHAVLPDETFDLRLGETVYSGIGPERLAALIAGGDILVVDAISTGEDDWSPPSRHPALSELRRHTADSVHRILDSESDVVDEEAEAADESEPPAPASTEHDVERAAETPPAEKARQTERTSGFGLLGASALVLAVLAALGGILLANRGSESRESASAGDEAVSEPSSQRGESATTQTEAAAPAEEHREVDEAVRTARRLLRRATSFDPSEPELQRRTAEYLEARGRHRRATLVYDALWNSGDRSASFADHYLNLLLQTNRYSRVRSVALEAFQRFDESERYASMYTTSLEEDDRLGEYRPVDLGERDDVDTIRPAGNLDFDGFVLEGTDGRPRYLFAPARRGAESWRDQVAAWRLCELVACGFSVARTRAARITRTEFVGMLNAGEDSTSVDLSAFQWKKGDDGAVDEGETFVDGALRTWPGEVRRWPIEADVVWRDWLSLHTQPEWNRSVRETLESQGLALDEPPHRTILETTGSWRLRDLASQLSGVLTFDYLTNNWDRFHRDSDAFGAAHHVLDEKFMTIRTDTVFQARGSRRVEGRFNWTSRFSRDFLTSLTLLERERTRTILYPRPGPASAEKFDIFWRQRKRILNRVEYLVEQHGRDTVLVFE